MPRCSQAGSLDELRTRDPRARSRPAKPAAWGRRSNMCWPICAARRLRPSCCFPTASTPTAKRWSTPPVTPRRKGVPLFTVAVGSEQPVRDLELADLLVDEVVFVDDVVNFEFKLAGHGPRRPHGHVMLRDKGKSEVLAATDVTVAADGEPQKVRLPYRPTEVGQFDLRRGG